ncbi:MAG: class I SAM-dependent methyltransferase [Verrucomicrobiota bacterium]|jgi:SAM-dependent methyltransferase
MDRLATSKRDFRWNFEAYTRDAWIKEQAAILPKHSWVLDAGAGASKYRPYFAHCRYETQDFCQYQGSLVKYVEPIKYVCDITSIPLPSQSLDAILCTEVIEHVVDPMAVLKEFARLLKPCGRLFLTAPLLSSLHMEPYHFYGGFTHYWYRHWLPHHGFSVDEIRPVGGPGRTSVIYVQGFYSTWSEQEKKLTPMKRVLSKCFRALMKIRVLYILRWLLPKMDTWLGGNIICSGYLVAATRNAP